MKTPKTIEIELNLPVRLAVPRAWIAQARKRLPTQPDAALRALGLRAAAQLGILDHYAPGRFPPGGVRLETGEVLEA